MDNLAWAITGRPDVEAGGARSDFGYVGDNGALPSSLDDLTQNPGGWSTWNGPYIDPGANDEFKTDAWGAGYSYNGLTITSTGSGSAITKAIAADASDLLSNNLSGTICDADQSPPGEDFADSLLVQMICPDGSGSTAATNAAVEADGRFSFMGLPIGNHTLRVIYLPDNDTTRYLLTILPGRDTKVDIVFPSDLW
jgi:hypothetical protein